MSYNQIHRFGTQAEYEALKTAGSLNSNYLYFTSDTGKLYKGTIDYTNSLIKIASVPATGVDGKIYYETGSGQIKTYIDNEWVVLSYPLTTSIDSQDPSNAKVASEAAIVSYVENMVGGDGVVADIKQKMNAGTAVAGTLTVTKGDASTFDVTMTGTAINPSWDAETRVLTIPVAGGTTVTANIGKDIFLDPGAGKNYFDSETKEIVLTLNDDPENPTVIRIPASALYNDYTGETTNSGTVSIDGTTHSISFDLNINDSAANALVLDQDGLMVDLSNYATTAALDGVRESLQGQINNTTATLAATTASLGTLENNYNNTTATLATLEGNYNNTTAALDTLTTNYNATTVKVAEIEGNLNATTAKLDTLETNYNATTVQVATNTSNISDLATAATTWAGFSD